MEKRCIAVLNYGRKQSDFSWFKDLDNDSDQDLITIFATNGKANLMCDINIDITGMNVAQSRNAIIEICNVNGIKNLHLVDDDIEIIDASIFDKYEHVSKLLEIPYVNNGFTNSVNDVAGLHNPRLKCKLGRYSDLDFSVLFNAHHPNGYSYYNLEEIGTYKYDEQLNCLEDNMYLFTLVRDKKIPFFNFFVDIEKSWTYINNVDKGSIRTITDDIVLKDQQHLESVGYKWEHFNNVDAVIEYIIDKIDKGECNG
jgi:hypothetical protein